jgi:hypothetical protein
MSWTCWCMPVSPALEAGGSQVGGQARLCSKTLTQTKKQNKQRTKINKK